MPTPQRIDECKIHTDFPVEPILGAVGGAHPKLLLSRGANGTSGRPKRSAEEIVHSFEAADDFANPLVTYFKRKKMAYPKWAYTA